MSRLDFAETLPEFFRPRDRRPIYEWSADGGMILSPPYTKTGPFNVSESRHLIGPLDSCANDKKRETNICAPARGGKTLVGDADLCHTIAEDPGDTLCLFQDDKAARDHGELRIYPTLRNSPKLRVWLPKDKDKERTQELLLANGMVIHFRGPADSNLQQRGYRKVKLDECWLYKEGKLKEATGRLGDYVKLGISKLLCLSQGGFKGSDWDRQFNRGLIYQWFVQCMSCGKFFFPMWTGHRSDGSMWGMRWDHHKNASGLWDIPKCMPTIRYECEHCAHPHIWGTRTKTEWNRTGKYTPEDNTEKLPTKDSFTWTAVIDYPWPELVDEYLQAINAWKMGVVEPLIQFFQKWMAVMSSEDNLLENKLNFAKARYEIQSKPENAVRILSADRQDEDVYWVMVRDWYPTTEEKRAHTKRVWYGKCHSAGEIEQKRIDLGIEPRRVLIDSGFKPKGDHGVYAYCIRYGWIPVKGVATDQGDPVAFKHSFDDDDGNPVAPERSYSEPVTVDAEIGRGKEDLCQMIKFSSPTFADRVDALIERGLWIEPEPDASNISPEMERELHIQMTAEYSRAITVGNKQTRRTKKVRVCPSGNNHGYDCAKIQVLGATVLEILPDLEVEQAAT